ERIETVFRRLEVAPSAHLSRPFESAVAEADELAGSIVDPQLEDAFRAQAALHIEHWEIASYSVLLELARRLGKEDDCRELRESPPAPGGRARGTGRLTARVSARARGEPRPGPDSRGRSTGAVSPRLPDRPRPRPRPRPLLPARRRFRRSPGPRALDPETRPGRLLRRTALRGMQPDHREWSRRAASVSSRVRNVSERMKRSTAVT